MKIFDAIYMNANKEVKQSTIIAESTRTVTTQLLKAGIAKKDILRCEDVTENILGCTADEFIQKMYQALQENSNFNAMQFEYIKNLLK